MTRQQLTGKISKKRGATCVVVGGLLLALTLLSAAFLNSGAAMADDWRFAQAPEATVPPVKREAPKTPAPNSGTEPADKKPSDWATQDPGFVGRVQDWLARANRAFQFTVVKKLSVPPSGNEDAIAQKLQDVKAEEASKKAEQDKRKAEADAQAAAARLKAQAEPKPPAAAPPPPAAPDDTEQLAQKLREERQKVEAETARLEKERKDNEAKKLEEERLAAEARIAEERRKAQAAKDDERKQAAERRQKLAEEDSARKRQLEEEKRQQAQQAKPRADENAQVAERETTRRSVTLTTEPISRSSYRSSESRAPTRHSRIARTELADGPVVGRWVHRVEKARCRYAGKRLKKSGRYVVRQGDTLWLIAKRFYNSGEAYRRIYRANRATLDDPDVIRPCQRLVLPKRRR